MKYFEIYCDVNIAHLPQIENRYNEFERQKGESVIIFSLKDDCEMQTPGILIKPFFLINDKIKLVLEKYEPNFSFKTIILTNHMKHDYLTYYMPDLPVFETVDDGKKMDKVIFYLKDVYEKHIIVRLDFMESIMRREMAGYLIKEV